MSIESNKNETANVVNERKQFFMSRKEYNSVKSVINFRNFNVVHSPYNNEDGFWFYSKK